MAPDSITDLPCFVLTRQWFEKDDGLELIFWLASEQGPLRLCVPGQEALCFLPADNRKQVERVLGHSADWRLSATRLKDFAHRDVIALYCRSRRRLFDLCDRLAKHGIVAAERDIRPPDRFLMERFITGAVAVSGASHPADGFRQVHGSRLRATDYRPRLRAVAIDIETDYKAESLYSIALWSDAGGVVLMIDGERPGTTTRLPATSDRHGTAAGKPLLRFHADEKSLLQAFIGCLDDVDPDVLLGWNVVNFDLRCLQKFADRHGVPLAVGRNRETITWRRARDTEDRFYALLPGRVVLDGIDLMRSATYRFENFSLEHIARELLGRGKLIEDVDGRGAEITELFHHDKAALADYNLEDCRLVWDIFAREDLIGFAIERSRLTGLELDRYGGSVAALDFLYLPRLHRKGFVAPAPEPGKNVNPAPGGYVMASVPGIHDNVVVLDFKSLYPAIIRTFHVDPLALTVGPGESRAIQGYDGGVFSMTQHLLPSLIENLWAAREQARADGNVVLSRAIKIIMNSFYGVLGTPACRFFDSRLVSSITRRGHEIIIESRKFIERRGYQVIYGDTDSVFVLLGAVSNDRARAIGEELAARLNQWWRDEIRRRHGVESFLEIEFETHYRKFLMPTVRGSDAGSKKRYAGLLAGDEVQFKGLESVRSDWSPLARTFQQVLYRKIFLDERYEDYVKGVVGKLLDGGYESELVIRKRLRRRLDDYVKNIPPHVQAARKAEAIRRERKLPARYRSGGWIEYVMTVNGPEPKPYRQSPVDYDFYIDRQLAPVADAILVFKSSSMGQILNRQMGLFED